MILPNMPRLIRTGDQLTVTATVANQSEITGDAVIVLKLKDHLSGKDLPVLDWLFNGADGTHRQSSAKISWGQITVPDGNATTVEYTISVIAGNKGEMPEMGILPVITDDVLITEALPLIIRPRRTEDCIWSASEGRNKMEWYLWNMG